MMAIRFLILSFACWALSEGAAAAVAGRGEAPGDTLRRHAADIQETLSEQFNTIAHSNNTQQLGKAIQQGSDSVIKQIAELTKSLQATLDDANRRIKETLEQARQNLEHTAEELRKAHPDVEKQATTLRDKLQTAVQKTVQETQKLAKEVAANMEQTNKKLAPKIKEAYDDFVKQAEQVQKKLHETATKQS